jgi:predicted peptidase
MKPNARIPTTLMLLAWLCLPGLTGFNAMSQSSSDPNTKTLQAKAHEPRFAAGAGINYLLFLPADYQTNSSKRWPLIFFLHGAGERGSDVWKVAVHGPSKYILNHPEFPFILVAPQCPTDGHWSNDQLLSLLDDVTKRYQADSARIYLTGLSMGGYGTWNLGTSFPEKFAAIVPISGGGEMIGLLLNKSGGHAAALKSLPVWAFHGGRDTTVPQAESERMVKAMKDLGDQEVELTIYPEAGHDAWTQTYNNPKLYEWLLQHRRGPGK